MARATFDRWRRFICLGFWRSAIPPLKIAAVQATDGPRHEFARPATLLESLTKLSEL